MENDLPKLQPMVAIMPIYFASMKFSLKRNIGLGLDNALENIPGSRDFVLAFRQCYPTVWQDLMGRLNLDDQTMESSLLHGGNTKEPLLEKTINEKQRRKMRIGLLLSLSAMDPKWTLPVDLTYREVNLEGRDGKVLVSETRWLEVLLSRECEARDLFLQHVTSDVLETALKSLTPSNDMPTMWSKVQENMSEGLAAAGHGSTAAKYEKIDGPLREPKPTQYEIIVPPEDPDLNLTPEQVEFDAHIERWVEAARAEAAKLRSPKILFDHLFLRLIGNDTETSELLDSKGVDRIVWAEDIRSKLAQLPTSDLEPRLSKEIGDSIPEDTVNVDLFDAMQAAKEAGINNEKDPMAHWELFEESAVERAFSDLMWLEKEPFKHKSRAWELLRSIGITDSEVSRLIQIRQGYPDPKLPPWDLTN